jgi:integrase/recombinase XerD
MMLLDAGLRIGEIVRLKMNDLHLDEGIIKVLGKGKKEHCFPDTGEDTLSPYPMMVKL